MLSLPKHEDQAGQARRIPPTVQPGFGEDAMKATTTRVRWYVMFAVFLIVTVSYLDRTNLSVAAPTLQRELHLTPTELGLILSAFSWSYALAQIPAGFVAAWLKPRRTYLWAMWLWCLLLVATTTATSFGAWIAFRIPFGLAEAITWPAASVLLARWFPRIEYSQAMSLQNLGLGIGAAIAPPIVAFISAFWGGRTAFIITGLMGFVLLAAWWKFYDVPERHRGLTEQERHLIVTTRAVAGAPAARAAMTMRQMLLHPLCLGFFVMRFLTDSTTYFFSFWLPDYLQHGRGFTLAMIGLVGWLPFLAADIGGPGGGALSDWLVRRGWAPSRARRRMMLIAACLMPLALVAVRTESAWIALALIAVLLAAQSCWMANQLTLIAESVARENVATLIALSAMGGSIGGILSNLGAGRAIGAYGYVPVFTVIGGLHLAAFGVLVLAGRRAAHAA